MRMTWWRSVGFGAAILYPWENAAYTMMQPKQVLFEIF
jgi:hypothetical protein